jgi:hypothetical protein
MDDRMNTGKNEERKELQRLVDEYLESGGEIVQVPIGVSGNGFNFHGHRTLKGKAHLHSLSNKSKDGFHKHRIYLKGA